MTPTLLLTLACRAGGPSVLSAAETGVVPQSASIQGRDGGQSALLFGRSVWTFGDTVLNMADEDGRNWHHNSVSWSEDLTASDGLDGFVEPADSVGAPAHLIAPTAEEEAFNEAHWDDGDCEEPCGARWAVWPGSPVWDEAHQRAILFYGLIYAEPGDFNFEGRGASIAIWSDPEGSPSRPEIGRVPDHPDLLWAQDEGEWGNASAIEGDHLYTFSCPQDGFGRPCGLARVALDRLLDPEAWRFWTGAGWGAAMEEVEPLFDGAPIMSLSYNAYLSRWLVIYSPSLSADIVARAAPALTGPWSKETVLYTPDGADEDPYDAVHHPELSEDGGRVEYLSWSRSTGEGWFGTEFALLRVEFE